MFCWHYLYCVLEKLIIYYFKYFILYAQEKPLFILENSKQLLKPYINSRRFLVMGSTPLTQGGSSQSPPHPLTGGGSRYHLSCIVAAPHWPHVFSNFSSPLPPSGTKSLINHTSFIQTIPLPCVIFMGREIALYLSGSGGSTFISCLTFTPVSPAIFAFFAYKITTI